MAATGRARGGGVTRAEDMRTEGARVLIDLTVPTGSPVTTTQLAGAVGLSAQTIRREIALQELNAGAKKGPTGRRRYLIPWAEARRYAIQIGVLRHE